MVARTLKPTKILSVNPAFLRLAAWRDLKSCTKIAELRAHGVGIRVSGAIHTGSGAGFQPAIGVWTFSPRLAERDNDGSRGLKPKDRGQTYDPGVAERRLNGQTRRWRSTVAPRRVTTILPL